MNFLYLSAEELVSRGSAVLLHCVLLPNTHLSSRYFNQADLKASPHSSSCQDRFPEVSAVRQEARDCTVHTISSSPLSAPLSQTWLVSALPTCHPAKGEEPG